MFISGYVPNSSIPNDALKEPLFAWCATQQPTISTFLDWCTVAPSDGIYYGSTGIPDWTNSLLVVTLKNGASSDQELYQFKLNPDGISFAPSTPSSPNPRKFFAADQALNGRLRDIAISPDGTKLYLINNGGSATDKITIYTYDTNSGLNGAVVSEFKLELFPNPSHETIQITCSETIVRVELTDLLGHNLFSSDKLLSELSISNLEDGIYICNFKTLSGKVIRKKIVKE